MRGHGAKAVIFYFAPNPTASIQRKVRVVNLLAASHVCGHHPITLILGSWIGTHT